MTMYNTGNPLGSTDPKDLNDNAQVFDNLVVGTSPRVTDRLGRERLSWAGLEYEFNNAQGGRDAAFSQSESEREAEFQQFLESSGFYPLGDYRAGLVFTTRTQFTVRSGSPYRLSNSATLPYTTTGDWGTEQFNFVLFSQDDVLRQDLGQSNGAALVGYGGEDVKKALGFSRPVQVTSLSEIALVGLREGDHCAVNGSSFLVTGQIPKDVRYPLISAGVGLYAVPIKDALDLRLGSFVEQGNVTDAAKFASASKRSHQGAVIDNQNNRIFLTAAETPDGLPQSGTVYEYEYSGGAIGPLVASSSNVDYGSGVFTPDSAGRALIPATRTKLSGGGPLRVLCYGDSVTWGWNGSVGSGQVASPYPAVLGARLTAVFQASTVTMFNKGTPGWRTTEGLANLASEVTANTPDLVLVMFGINDCQGSSFGAALTTAQYKTNLGSIVDGIRAAGSEVVVMAPTPLRNANATAIQAFVTAAQEVAAEKTAAFINTHADVQALFSEGYETPAGLIPDNVHFAEGKYFNLSDVIFGRLLSRSAGLAFGHGDFVAVTTNGSARHLWYHRPSGAGTYAGGGALVRLPWADGATEAQVDVVIPLAGYFDTRRAEVQNYDAEHLSIRGVQTYICKISDLALGNFSPVEILENNPTPQGLTAVQPQQQFAHMAGYWFGYSGAFRQRKLNGFLLAGSMDGDLRGSYIYDSSAPAEAELEGLCWRWNGDLAKFEVCLTDYRASTGQVIVYNQATGNIRQYARSFPLMQRQVTSASNSQWSGGASMVSESPNPISAPALLVGGYDSAAAPTSNSFDPEDLRIEQIYSVPGGRKGARLRFFKNGDLIFDGSEDSVFGAGVRFALGGINCMHVRPDGLHVGDAHQTGAQLGKVQARGTSTLPCFYTTVANVGYYSNGAFDYTVEEGTTMQIGSWNSTTKVGTTWYNASVSSFGPSTDNTKDLGTASNRWAVVRAGTGTINTSDGRLKQQIRELSEAERAVAVRLKGMIRAFKFNDAVEQKGGGARIHIGVIAQEVRAAFEAEGLVAEDYAILCHDKWEETPEKFDEEGSLISARVLAGDRYGVRYEELLAFIISAL